jgi:hypothetical protein
MPADATYQRRARRFAGFYMGEDPEAPNYDRAHKIGVKSGDRASSINAPQLTVHLDPGCGAKLVLTMRRYANQPKMRQPW